MPFLTVLLVLANLAVYLLGGDQAACQTYGLIPATFMNSGNLEPVFSAMFLHANLTHLVGNLVFLALFGVITETEIGHIRFAFLYFAAGIGGALLHVATDPSATNAMVGCSGCVFGLIALVAARRPRFLGCALAFGAVEIWHALIGGAGSVSFGAHLGGLAIGVFFALLMRMTASFKEERFA